MITQLTIENYKSIQALTLDVGRVNVLIGENGCGKSNILEAITFAAAAEAKKLDNEFLSPRGIRVTEPKLMRSNFDKSYVDKEIKIEIKFNNYESNQKYSMNHDNEYYSKWFRKEINIITAYEKIDKEIKERRIKLNELKSDIQSLKKKEKNNDNIKILANKINNAIIDLYSDTLKFEEMRNNGLDKVLSSVNILKNFVVFSPENTALRNLEKEAQIEPLGINGEGLLKLLSVIQHESPEQLTDIQESLELFDWYDSLIIPNELSPLERKLTIQDRYLAVPFDQRSANEGFLFVLFYITLMVSNYTPKIFAIDNIDTSLNPKLCTKLIKVLSDLAKKYDKQFFVTTHNPAILDGINLGDDEQRLIVVSRNEQGHTCCDHIKLQDKPKPSIKARLARLFENDEFFKSKETFSKDEILSRLDDSPETLKLSEAFLRGYLGGLPTGF